MLADWAASKIAEVMTGTFSGIGNSISGMFSGIFSSISSSIAGLASRAASVLTGGAIGGGAAAAGGAAASQAAIAAGTSTMASSAAAAAGGGAAGGAGVGATVAAGLAKAGAAISGAASSALAFLGPGGIALLAGGALASVLDSGGTPTSTAGLTMAKTGGMTDDNIFQMDEFASGFAPLGFKQNATNAQAEASVKPLRDIDAALTALTKEAGFDVNLGGHTFSGLGVEGSGPGTVLGTFVEEGKEKGTSIEKQMDNYAAEWVKAVGARNNISSEAINEIIGNGSAETIMDNVATEMGRIVLANQIASSKSTESALQDSATEQNATESKAVKSANELFAEGMARIAEEAQRKRLANMGPFTTMMGPSLEKRDGSNAGTISTGATTLSIDGSHRGGLDMVPHDGYVAELHAGERVQTANQARSADDMADEMSGLRQSIEEVMVAVARSTSKLYRLNDRWDKNGLPPVRA